MWEFVFSVDSVNGEREKVFVIAPSDRSDLRALLELGKATGVGAGFRRDSDKVRRVKEVLNPELLGVYDVVAS